MTKTVFTLLLFLTLIIGAGLVAKREQEIYQQTPAEGNYIFKIKGPSHKKLVFCQDNQDLEYQCVEGEGIYLESGKDYALDFTQRPLGFGDVNFDGSVGVNDWSAVLGCRNADSKRGEELFDIGGCRHADSNFDGEVNNFGLDLLYKTLAGEPDDE